MKPKLDPVWSLVILAVGALAVWLAWNSEPVARLVP
jgi:hypothetical protein